MPGGKKDTARNRAELGHPDYPPESAPDIRLLSFKLQDELNEHYKSTRENSRRKNACKKCDMNPKASPLWPFCHGCTVCARCRGERDGVRTFRVVGGVPVCNDCQIAP